jgi:glycosyltransferase involved in cell wall biosynthesis
MRRIERTAARRAGAIVTLTTAAIDVLAARHGPSIIGRTVVIPTCVDLSMFPSRPAPPLEPIRLLLSGSLNRYYDVTGMLLLVRALRRRAEATLDVVTPGPTPWDHTLEESWVTRSSAQPHAIPELVAASHVGLSLCRTDAGVSLTAAMPTKIAEFLACGRPVVVSPGLGDMEEIVRTYRCGVVADVATPEGVERAVDDLLALLVDPDTAQRCRAAAEARFDVERGVDTLLSAYRLATS